MPASAALDLGALAQLAPEPPPNRVARVTVREKARAATPLALVKSDSAAMLEAITDGARDPLVTVDKMDFLGRLYERAKAEEARLAFTGAMNAAQADMTPIVADAYNDDTSSRYATYAALDRVMRPIYIRHGFTVSFTTEPTDRDRHERIVIVLDHVDGHQKSHRAEIPSDGLDDAGVAVMTRVHATASAFTYGQRYMLGLAFNIAVDKDRDGNAIRSVDLITPLQVTEIANRIDRTGADEAALLRHLKVNGLADIPASMFAQAVCVLDARDAREAR